MRFQSVKGTKDLLPADTRAWRHIEAVIRASMDAACYGEIRTPIFEETAVFSRGIGEETDIVGKEMYTFADKGGASLTLRPEMTAPVVRAALQHSLPQQSTLNRLFYIGPMFRQERPQAGRFRQFHQFGMECIGLDAPACDAEVIALAADIYARLGVRARLKINSVGDAVCRPRYREALQHFLRTVEDGLSAESRRRMETNPLRVLDSKDEGDRAATANAPSILDHLTPEADAHFRRTLALLDGLGIPYEVDPRLVRGLDYYTLTAFEFVSADLGSQDALGGGGRYDGLAEQLGGARLPAVGFAAGMERLLMVMEKNGFTPPERPLDVFVAALDDESRDWAFGTVVALRRAGMKADTDFAGRSLKAQMREANRLNARRVVIVGEDEMRARSAQVKHMATGAQDRVSFDDLAAHLTQD